MIAAMESIHLVFTTAVFSYQTPTIDLTFPGLPRATRSETQG